MPKKAKCKKCKKEFDKKDMMKVIEGYSCYPCWNKFVKKEYGNKGNVNANMR